MKNILPITIHRAGNVTEQIELDVKRVFNAGWAGRDRAAVQHHIDELAAVGVPAPMCVPTLFALGNHLLTTADAIQVHGDDTSGEVEYVLFWHHGEVFVTLGSDHTDRRLEKHSIPKSKNLCLNVMAPEAWPYAEVKEHFDQLILDCSVTRNGVDAPYQHDVTGALIGPDYWIKVLEQRIGRQDNGLVLFSGAIGTIAGLVVGDAYSFRMLDPVLGRSIEHSYSCEILTGAMEDY